MRATLAAALLLAGCTRAAAPAAPAPSTAELLAAEQAIFDAFAHRDARAMAALVTDDFVLRMPGSPDVTRAAFLDGVPHTPGGVMDVSGEELSARVLAPDLGVVSGVQVSRLALGGKIVVDRGAFSDVFRRGADGKWRATFAYTVPLPAH